VARGVVAAFASLISFFFLVVNYFDDVRRGAERGLTLGGGLPGQLPPRRAVLTRDVIRPREYKFPRRGRRRGGCDGAALGEAGAEPARRRLSRQDVVATLKVPLLSVVVRPLLPDRAFGPIRCAQPAADRDAGGPDGRDQLSRIAAIRFLGPQRGLGLTDWWAARLSTAVIASQSPCPARACSGVRTRAPTRSWRPSTRSARREEHWRNLTSAIARRGWKARDRLSRSPSIADNQRLTRDPPWN